MALTISKIYPQGSSKGFKATSLGKVTAKASLWHQCSVFIRHFITMTKHLSETKVKNLSSQFQRFQSTMENKAWRSRVAHIHHSDEEAEKDEMVRKGPGTSTPWPPARPHLVKFPKPKTVPSAKIWALNTYNNIIYKTWVAFSRTHGYRSYINLWLSLYSPCSLYFRHVNQKFVKLTKQTSKNYFQILVLKPKLY